jgi:predicted lactoylglutathione lyase
VKIPRITVLTLGVADLGKATRFYESVLSAPGNKSYEGVVFFELPGSWLSLYPRERLAEDISSEISLRPAGFSGVTLAYNARSRQEVEEIIAQASEAGGCVVKPPQETFWGGFSGYFADPDGHFWEVAWGPMFTFSENGELRFQDPSPSSFV